MLQRPLKPIPKPDGMSGGIEQDADDEHHDAEVHFPHATAPLNH